MTDRTLAAEKDHLLKEVREALADTEELIAAAGEGGSEQARRLREKATESLKAAKESLIAAEQKVVQNAKAAAKATDQYVHDNPWKAIGLTAIVAFLLGLLVSRR